MSPDKVSAPAPTVPSPAPPPDPVLALARLADTLGNASTDLFNYRRSHPDAPDLERVVNLETTLDRRTIELRTQAIRLLGAQVAEALARMQDACGKIDAFLAEVKTIEARLTLASAAIALAGATLVGDAGGILTAIVGVHSALEAAQGPAAPPAPTPTA